MKRIALLYNILIIGTFLGASLISARSLPQVLFTFIFVPPLIYFLRLLTANLNLNQKTAANIQDDPVNSNRQLTVIEGELAESDAIEAELINDPEIGDINRRLFLKLIGGAGISVFVMSLFTDKAHASFFGSMPVPGAMTVKDSTGQAIDPAEKQPTDGYEVSDIDDEDSPAYYGFIHKTGAWYISRDDGTGSYRYVKGASGFPDNWAIRDTLSYDYFDSVF